MTHRFTAGTLGTLAAALVFAYAPLNAAHAAANQPAPAVSAPQAQKQLQRLADRYYDAQARFNPLNATTFGDNRYDDQLGKGIVPAVRARQFALYRQFLASLNTIKRAQLASKDQVSYDILGYELKTALAFETFPEHLLPLNQLDSVPVVLANYASGEGPQPISNVKQYDAYLSRIGQLPAWIDQAIANMREGIRDGVVLPKSLIASALPQFQKLLSSTPETSIYYTPVTKFPANFSDADKQRLTQSYRAIIGAKLMPALARLARFVENDYLPAGRDSSGRSALPNGAAWYQANVAAQTSTTLQPEQIHQIGLKEVARIQQQYAIIGPKLGYDGPPAGLPAWVAAQEKFRPFKTDQEVLDVYRKLNEQLNSKLPALFTLVPKVPLELRLEPELSRDTAASHYTAPAPDGTRPGVFWLVVTDPKRYPSTGMTTLFLHEGKPGHHFQIALTQELNLPDFRKFGDNNAFIEGWALYAETLGKEMDLFNDPAQYFGNLNDEMVRAVRLVIDTGLHAKGWSREKTIQYMSDTLGYDTVAKRETERYMAWPGQALGYKIGSLKILELRQRAEAALGPKFSLPKFHAVVLDDGPLPLNLLEAKVDRWIAEQK
ncbi:conserved hypothetical protein [Janthinobacterium agaricidamnosum NBRC 102515 = DSM 9628]|uniref:DUF885 domain-containing protein n=2 Tax=Janthinobacterium agaricidamnosum TaxID=55508 RepID=W0V9U6_9BURK|nr:DUF885 domain-containing protein [Janthinobacterium agaricidamnosum]CDG85589.1 conserved hypothetical protein [Janthinobacterium agaricidamnosum NBRC 102515 = DSM 9628]